MVKNTYIHIPFCKDAKCNYCSFVSYTCFELKDKYLDALKKQIQTEYKGEQLNTLYFGGGTPSLLTISEIKTLIDLFEININTEITIEMNPDSVDTVYLRDLKEIGINRISIGSQTFNDKILKIIGRRHSSEQIELAVKFAKDAGFDNISLDLIYGLPTQNIVDFEDDLKKAIDLNVQHISLYGLKIEEGCYFSKHPIEHSLPDLDLQADMYLDAIEILKNNNFMHYEISNFTKTGFESKHNLNYWDNNNYYGFGLAASGYVDGVRYTNEIDLKEYIQNPFSKISKQKLTKQAILEEEIFLGFRKSAGINIDKINQKFGINFNEKYAKILEKYSKFFITTQNGYTLTTDGMLVSNEILANFI